MSERDKLIREAATVEADGIAWRNRMDRWLRLPIKPPLNFKKCRQRFKPMWCISNLLTQ